MIELRKQLAPSGKSAGLVQHLRPDVPRLVEGIVSQIQREVPAYAGPATGRRRLLLTMAVGAAINRFLDMLDGKPSSGRRVDDLFRRMGHGEALDGNDLDPMRIALRIASRDSWATLRAFAIEYETSADLLGRLGEALFGYIDHLTEEAALGFEGAQHALDADVGLAQLHLLDSLLSAAPLADIEGLAAIAEWPLPTSFVTMSVSFHGPFPSVDDLASSVLLRADTSPAVIICAADDTAAVTEELRRSVTGIRIALSWPVPIEDIPAAHGWTTRALQLVDQGVIAAIPVINCADQTTQLWLHSEPALRRRRCQELLLPLLTETPNSREILSETLLAWLESRDSAPAIADRLGVHPQTVRYRWKRINELFGENLRDREFVVQITMLLKASIPLWKAGDQSDFDHSHPPAAQ